MLKLTNLFFIITIPMVQIVLDENRDLEYFASLTNIKKI